MPISIIREGQLAVVTIDNPPVNALSQAVRQGLSEAVAELDADDRVRGVILHCAGRTFIAGADVKEFGKPPQAPHLPDVVIAIENAAKPWLAAIHGTALGGGLEVALGCSWRVMDKIAQAGLPEVNLGLIPGAGGTVRLPRLIGPEAALSMVAGGKPIAASRALELGVVDAVAEDDLLDFAKQFLMKRLEDPRPLRLSARSCQNLQEAFWKEQEIFWRKKARGQISPMAALQSIRFASENSFADALAYERRQFLELRQSEQANALRHMFFAERAASKLDAIHEAEPRSIQITAVIGGGTMGAGIAAAMLNAGLTVTMVEKDDESLAKGIANVRKILEGSVRRGLLSEAVMRGRLGALNGASDYESLSEADLIIEAVFENIELKRRIFSQLDQAAKPSALLATNTSYLDPYGISADIKDKSRFLGLHFFSPAHIMKLLEIVRTDDTAPDVLATAFSLSKRLGKVGVLAGICDGFIGNRILKIYRRQADFLLMDGCLPQDVDRAMRAFGFPMGPYEAQDLGGLDIAWANRKEKAASRGPDERYVRVADRLCELGRFGQKAGKGWYSYNAGSRTPQPDPEVERIILEESAAEGITRSKFSQDDILERILFPMINEGALILEEGIACRPLDIDLVEVHGYGFPRWRGGLMHSADAIGVQQIRGKLREWSDEDSAAYSPGTLLNRLADQDEDFASLN